MEEALCLICLKGVNSSTPKNVVDLCQLLTSPPDRFLSLDDVEDGHVDLCSLCWDLIHEMEMIEKQISQLQGQIGKRIVVVRNRILTSEHKYRQPQTVEESELQRLRSIRDVLLRMSRTTQDNNNMDSGEVEIKIEADEVLENELFDETEPTSPLTFILHPDEDGPIVKTDDNDNTDSDWTPTTQQRRPNLRRSPRRKPVELKKATIPPKRKVKTRLTNKKRIFKPAPPTSESEEERDHSTSPESGTDPFSSEEILDGIKTEDNSRGKQKSQSQKLLKDNARSKRLKLNQHSVSCLNCDRKFRTRTLLKTHHTQKHQNIPLNQCPICKRSFKSCSKLFMHTFARHETEDKSFTCGQCQKGFTVEFNFQRHLELHQVEGSKPFVCELCDSRWTNKARLDAHLASHNKSYNKSYFCKICSKACKSWNVFDRHRRKHAGKKPYKCEQCDERFLDYAGRSNHIAKVHSTPDEHFLCPVCGKQFYSSTYLKQHIARHEGISMMKCDLCSETFQNKGTLRSHEIEKHGADPFICDECGTKFKSERGLVLHKTTRHALERSFKCDICHATFTRKDVLAKHMVKHTGERAHPCPHCTQKFKHNSNLREHIKSIHSENFTHPTPRECSYPDCGKKFRFPGLLRNHIRQVHTMERPFRCEVCDKGFSLQSTLTLHNKSAHGIISGRGDGEGGRLPRSKRKFPAGSVETSKNKRRNSEPSCSSSNSSSNNDESLAGPTQFTL